MYSHPYLTPQWAPGQRRRWLHVTLSVSCLILAALLATAWQEIERLSDIVIELRARERLWTDCAPPVGYQRLRVELDWRKPGAIPRYDYRCIYSDMRRKPEAEILSRPPKVAGIYLEAP